jgi:hypothetical protein
MSRLAGRQNGEVSLAELLDLDPAPTVGVITPHTEQQAYIAKLAHEHPRWNEFDDKLRLKIMTFDTCQGEEREVVFYSLVATAEKDRLAYIFPSNLHRDSDDVDHPASPTPASTSPPTKPSSSPAWCWRWTGEGTCEANPFNPERS